MWPTNQDASKAPPAAIGIPVKLPPPNQSYNNPIPQQQSLLQNVHEAPWSTDLFDCFSDVPNCCTRFWCPCITFGQIAEIVDKGSTSCAASGALYAIIFRLTHCNFVYSGYYRSKLRQQYGLQESPCDDCLVHLCCEFCALCQEHRELQHRGFLMHIGWHANMKRQNMKRQNQGVDMAPPTALAMSREGDLRPLVLSGEDDNI